MERVHFEVWGLRGGPWRSKDGCLRGRVSGDWKLEFSMYIMFDWESCLPRQGSIEGLGRGAGVSETFK